MEHATRRTSIRRRVHIRASSRSEEHTSELQSRSDLVCRLLLEKKNTERHEIGLQDCYHIRDRFHQKELWQNLRLSVEKALQVPITSQNLPRLHERLFRRSVPTS